MLRAQRRAAHARRLRRAAARAPPRRTRPAPLPRLTPAASRRTFCECNLCQVYSPITRNQPSPPLENAIFLTNLQAGVESNQTLCLNHWTFYRVSTLAPPFEQRWHEDLLDTPSHVPPLPDLEIPRTVTITFDTDWDSDADRFTTVDAFIYEAGLPSAWFEVHRKGEKDYPQSIFSADKYRTEYNLVDSFTHVIGFDGEK